MDELAKIGRVIEREAPESSVETLLVLDGTTGQNALNQAREFGNACPITGIVLTKLDGTARGGVVIGIRKELNIFFIILRFYFVCPGPSGNHPFLTRSF